MRHVPIDLMLSRARAAGLTPADLDGLVRRALRAEASGALFPGTQGLFADDPGGAGRLRGGGVAEQVAYLHGVMDHADLLAVLEGRGPVIQAA